MCIYYFIQSESKNEQTNERKMKKKSQSIWKLASFFVVSDDIWTSLLKAGRNVTHNPK